MARSAATLLQPHSERGVEPTHSSWIHALPGTQGVRVSSSRCVPAARAGCGAATNSRHAFWDIFDAFGPYTRTCQSLLHPRTAAAVAAAAPPFPSVCLVCESVLSVTPVPASCVSPPRLRLSSHSEIYLSRISSEVKSHEKPNVKLSPVEVSAVACRVRAAIVTGEACAASNDAQKTGHTNAVKDRRWDVRRRAADTAPSSGSAETHTGRRTMRTIIACHAPSPTSGGRGAPANSSGEPACAAR